MHLVAPTKLLRQAKTDTVRCPVNVYWVLICTIGSY